MTLSELKRLTEIGEGLHLEFKLRLPRAEKIVREVVGFANTRGGKVLVGVDDDGAIKGVKDVQEELFVLDTTLASYCHPTPAYSVERVPVTRKREVIVIDVPPSPDKPHFLVLEQNGNRQRTAFIRIRDQVIEASREMVRLMKLDDDTKDVKFEYGKKEHTLMNYLDRFERITVAQFARVANIPKRRAAQTLVLLTRANVLRIHPDEKQDYFTLAYDLDQV